MQLDQWISGSKAVDADGAPLVLYHGTNQAITRFKEERLGANTGSVSSVMGFWFTDNPAVAQDYANQAAQKLISSGQEHLDRSESLLKEIERAESRGDWPRAEALTHELEAHDLSAIREGDVGQNIVPVHLSVRNPLIVDARGRAGSTGEGARIIQQARAAGHDGVIFLNSADTSSRTISNHFVVFDSTQIRSAISPHTAFEKRPKFASPRLSQVVGELLDLPYADRIMVFGSYAGEKDDPVDIDVFVDLRGIGRARPESYQELLHIGARHYGWLDPFLRTDEGLLVRSDTCGSWVKAKNARELCAAMDAGGVCLRNCIRLLHEADLQGEAPADTQTQRMRL